MLACHDQQTIIAQCTPKGSGAIALLRISGDEALAITDKLSKLADGSKVSLNETHSICYGWVIDAHNSIIDEVLFLIMKAPHSFTGQNVVEITCHNNPFIIEHIIRLTIFHGARLARTGEFTQRAVLTKKIDLIQAEAINDLIHANTQQAIQLSLKQLSGTLSAHMLTIEQRLLRALALTQASFEFLDEEMTFGDEIKDIINQLDHEVQKLCLSFEHQKQIREGFRIAFIGSVNVGKSSLFNLLLGHNRAIVTPIAGTTRDTLEAGLYKHGTYWTLIDTAGLRKTDDIIEHEGIVRSHQEAQKADIVLLVFDGSRAMTTNEHPFYEAILEQHAAKTILVRTKGDLVAHESASPSSIKEDLISSNDSPKVADRLEHVIKNFIEKISANAQSPFLINKRHLGILLDLKAGLTSIAQLLCAEHIAYELVAYQLNDLLAHLTNLTGKSVSENAMDEVFRAFCVGK